MLGTARAIAYRRLSQSLEGAQLTFPAIRLAARLQRKDARLPVFVVIPASLLAGWSLERTTPVDLSVNGRPVGRRTLKKWDASKWFLELTAPVCRKLGLEVGDQLTLELSVADASAPLELTQVLARSPDAAARWSTLPASTQRQIIEHILNAKQQATRVKRATAAAARLGKVQP